MLPEFLRHLFRPFENVGYLFLLRRDLFDVWLFASDADNGLDVFFVPFLIFMAFEWVQTKPTKRTYL